MKKTLKGFTLIEMLIVIVIIGILAAVLIPKIGGAREKAEDVAIKANVRNLAQGILQAQIDQVGLSSIDKDWLFSGTMAQKYNFTLVTTNTGNYSFAKPDDNKHFVICGKLNDVNGGNSATGAEATWTEQQGGAYYCYKG